MERESGFYAVKIKKQVTLTAKIYSHDMENVRAPMFAQASSRDLLQCQTDCRDVLLMDKRRGESDNNNIRSAGRKNTGKNAHMFSVCVNLSVTSKLTDRKPFVHTLRAYDTRLRILRCELQNSSCIEIL